VDNNSHDETLIIIRDFKKRNHNAYENIIVISEESNIPEARNICIRYSIGGYVLFIDSDIIAPQTTIRKMLQIFTSNPKIRIVSFLYCPFPSMPFIRGMIYNKQPKVPYATDSIMMGCTMVVKDLFDNVGLFDPKYGAGEDLNLAVRASKSGFISVIDPGERVCHLTMEEPFGALRQITNFCCDLFKSNALTSFMIIREYKPKHMVNRLLLYLAMVMSMPLATIGMITRDVVLIFPFTLCYGTIFIYHFSKASGKWRLLNPIIFPLFGMSLSLGIIKEGILYCLHEL